MLKTLSTKSAKPKKNRAKVGGNSKARHDGRCKLDRNEIGDNEINDEIDDKVGKKSQKMSKSKKSSKSKKIEKSDFFTFRARLTFTKLRQTFVKTLILHYFDLEHHILVEMDVSGYDIGGIFSLLILDNLG